MSTPNRIIVCVLGLAVREDGKFLLTQRYQPESPDIHLKWQFPGGGLEFGETPEETLQRELQEEVGVTGNILHPQPICNINIWKEETEDVQVVVLCYLVSIGDQQPKIIDPESNAFGWFSKEEIEKLPCLPKMMWYIEEAEKVLEKIQKH